ncbi:MAG: BON domain-containing protein [Candidatus Binatia bacterium]
MALDRGERGHRMEQYPRRGDSERDRRDRENDDREFYGPREITDDDADYARPTDRRHWRGHDYYAEEEFERGRDYGGYDKLRQRPLEAQHRARFLRPGESGYAGRRVGDRRGQEGWGDDWSGPYAGRGPKGYRRSDERIQEEVCERLTEHPAIDASDIEVTVSDGDVTLTGRVESRAVKHLTEVMVETVSGVKEVHNQLRVAPLDQGVWSRSSSEEPREARAQEPITPRTRQR